MGLFDLFKDKNRTYLYTEEQINAYEGFIKESFGEFETVFHEIVSPDIHLDIIVVPPTEENNFYKLITMGMGAYEMNVPKQLMFWEFERAELIIYLPPDWNIGSTEKRDFWPIEFTKQVARVPINWFTWLGLGHTVSGSPDNEPFADNTGFCSMMLAMAKNHKGEELDFRLPGGEKLNFYQLVPIYPEELEMTEKKGVEPLLEIFEKESRVIDLNRKNYGL